MITVTTTPTSGTGDSSTGTFTVDVPKVAFGTISGVSSFGSEQRVPIFGGQNPIQGTADVTITPTLLNPPGTKIQFKMSKQSGQKGDANFDNGTKSVDLTISGALNIRGVQNSDAADNMEVDAYLNDNPNDEIIDDGSLDSPTQSILTFTVSTWPTNISCKEIYEYGGQGGLVGFIVSVVTDSESGSINDLGNCDAEELVTVQPWTNSTPPFVGDLIFDPTPTSGGIAIQNTGGYFEFPNNPLQCTGMGPSGNAQDIHTIPESKVIGPGNGSITINQQYQFQDNILQTGWMQWLGTGSGQYTISMNVTTNNTTNVRTLSVEKSGNGLNPPAFDGVPLN